MKLRRLIPRLDAVIPQNSQMLRPSIRPRRVLHHIDIAAVVHSLLAILSRRLRKASEAFGSLLSLTPYLPLTPLLSLNKPLASL